MARFALFVLVLVGVLVGWHGYLWVRLVRDPGWPAPVARWLTVVLLVMAASPLLLVAVRRFGAPHALALPAFGWIGFGFLLLCLLLLADSTRLLAMLWERSSALLASAPAELAPPDPARRQLVARSVAVAAGATALVAGGFGIRTATGEIEAVDVPVRLPRLPRALEGMTVVQITDVHIGSSLTERFLEGVVETTNRLKPDAVVITGDLVDGSVGRIGHQLEPLGRLRARWGTYCVTGNHEFYSGVDPWFAHLRQLGVRPLANERVTLGDTGPGGASIDLAGIHDFTGLRTARHAPDLDAALAGRDAERELLLAVHQPKAADMAAQAGVGLMMCGHTHGGQIFPWGALVRLTQPFLAGLHRRGDTHVYVSRGTGVWGPPMRVLAPAEITRFVLTS